MLRGASSPPRPRQTAMTAIRADDMQIFFISGGLRPDHLKNGFASRSSYACFSAPPQSPDLGLLDDFLEVLVAIVGELARGVAVVNPLDVLVQLLLVLERDGRQQGLELTAILRARGPTARRSRRASATAPRARSFDVAGMASRRHASQSPVAQ